MTAYIKDNEIGILFKDGKYKRILNPGKQKIWSLFGESYIRLKADGILEFPNMVLPVLQKDAEFAKNAVVVEVPDDRIAIHFIDGRISDVLKPGAYAYWNVIKKHTFEIVDVSAPDTAAGLPASWMPYIPSGYYKKTDVNEGEAGLLFYDGVYEKTLGPGQYYHWNYNVKVTSQTVDMRVQHLEIPGQEILTADKVSIRINFVCSYKISDPVNIVVKLKDYKAQLHVMVQLILREFTGKYRFDELLRQKDSIGGFALEKMKERENEFFVVFSDAGVKDIILPGEIRDIMNTVLVAEKSAQAGVITRREETAATKSLLDTAKLMDENATLYKLKELEYLERICDKIGSVSVEAGGGILKNLRELVSGKS